MAPPLTTGWVFNLQTIPDHSNALRIVTLAVVFCTLSFCAVLLRLWCRWHLLKTKGADDAAAIFSLVAGTAYSGVAILHTRWGLGLNVNDIPKDNILGFGKIQYIGGPLYPMGILGFKLCLLFTYLRLGGFQKKWRLLIWIVIILATLNSIIFAFVFAFTCNPPAKTWDRDLPGTCMDELSFYFAIAGSSLAFDLLIIGLPFPVLRTLQLDIRRKIAIGLLFGLGIFVTIVQIMRIQTIANLKVFTESQKPIMWSIVEIHVGTLTACIPTYTPLLRSIRTRMTTYSRSRGKSESWIAETGEVKVSRLQSHRLKSGNSKNRTLTTSRMSAPYDDEIALCDVPENGGVKTWIGPRGVAKGESESLDDVSESRRQLGTVQELEGHHRMGNITVTREVRVDGDDV